MNPIRPLVSYRVNPVRKSFVFLMGRLTQGFKPSVRSERNFIHTRPQVGAF